MCWFYLLPWTVSVPGAGSHSILCLPSANPGGSLFSPSITREGTLKEAKGSLIKEQFTEVWEGLKESTRNDKAMNDWQAGRHKA